MTGKEQADLAVMKSQLDAISKQMDRLEDLCIKNGLIAQVSSNSSAIKWMGRLVVVAITLMSGAFVMLFQNMLPS